MSDNIPQNPYESVLKSLNDIGQAAIEMTTRVVEALQPVLGAVEQLRQSIDFTAFFESEAMLNLRYLGIANELKWPIFCESDEQFRNYIIENENGDLKEYIISYYSIDTLNEKAKHWRAIEFVNAERFEILEEALLAYDRKMYYSAVSLCMCEMMGIITDLYDYCKKKGLVCEEDIQEFAESIGLEKIKNEKRQLLGVVGIQEYGAFVWHYSFEYIMDYTLSSKSDTEMFEHHPMRNKVCHGEQTNFGTQEHALKALLCIDMLMELGGCIKYTESNYDEERVDSE